MSPKGISLYSLNEQIKNVLSESFSSGIWIMAEISELRSNQNGHCYLELVEKKEDSDQIIAKARATIWSYTFRMLKPYFETSTGQTFSSGIKVLVNVSVEFQEIYGYSLNIKDIDPNYTIGDLARRKKEIINRLDEEGVLEMNKELEFPEVPKCIAIISSPTAAGYEDFTNQLENNPYNYKFHHKLFPAIMQGQQAEESIISALDRVNEFEQVFDLVVVIRGGGSSADLNCFNSYWLALNIAQFPLPIVSGIGHERDETIVDIVSNTRVKTPTAAAEFLIDCFNECRDYQTKLQELFLDQVNDSLLYASEKLISLTNKFSPIVNQILERKSNELNLAKQRITLTGKALLSGQNHLRQKINSHFLFATEKKINGEKTQINQLKTKLASEITYKLEEQKHNVLVFEQSIKYLTPENILKKGYCLSLKDGKIVKDIGELSPGDAITTILANGDFESRVKKISKNE